MVLSARMDEISTPTNKAFTIRLSEEQAEELSVIANVDGMATAEAVRRAVQAYIDERRGDQDFRRRTREALKRHEAVLRRFAE